ncbi:MAG: hypothetical protein ACK40X_14090, partial [Armatimonadota bacterium]
MTKALSACEVWLAKMWYSVTDWLVALFSGAVERHLVHTTQEGVEIFVERGRKPTSPHDFIVKFRDPRRSSHLRTPKHIHL